MTATPTTRLLLVVGQVQTSLLADARDPLGRLAADPLTSSADVRLVARATVLHVGRRYEDAAARTRAMRAGLQALQQLRQRCGGDGPGPAAVAAAPPQDLTA